MNKQAKFHKNLQRTTTTQQELDWHSLANRPTTSTADTSGPQVKHGIVCLRRLLGSAHPAQTF